MKKGFTVVSLVLYVMLFFTFTVFATAISTNLNRKILSEKGRIVINENYMKIYTNLVDSAKKSNSIDVVGNDIIFSNGDVYKYISANQELLKNSGNLANNINGFTIKNLTDVLGTTYDVNSIDIAKCISVNVSFKKYNESISKDIIITVGDDLNE